MIVEPAWIAAGLMLFSQVGIATYTLNRNGKSEAKWKGMIEERLDNVERQHETCRKEITESVSNISKQIRELHARVTKSQGAV